MRIVLVTGKGGVGKTTVAAATALAASDAGARVLVTSTDPAHSLSDALEVDLGSDPTPVAGTLRGQQIDTELRRVVREELATALTEAFGRDLR